jgi:dihydrofolate reductase
MTKVRCSIRVSVDGYVARPNQSLENAFGEGVDDRIHRSMFEQPDENRAEIEAFTSARRVHHGPQHVRGRAGTWDTTWNGWWGEDPPYHAPVFVLTHHEREPVTMQGETTYSFVTGGIEAAMEQPTAAAARDCHRVIQAAI